MSDKIDTSAADVEETNERLKKYDGFGATLCVSPHHKTPGYLPVLFGCPDNASNMIITFTAERDALRAEVERLEVVLRHCINNSDRPTLIEELASNALKGGDV